MHRRRPRSEKPLTEHEIDCNFEDLATFRQWYREHGEEEAWRRADEAGMAVPEFRRSRATTKELWDHYAARFGRYFLNNAELKRWNRGEETFPGRTLPKHASEAKDLNHREEGPELTFVRVESKVLEKWYRIAATC